MPVSPETEIAAAYALGRSAATAGQARRTNPFTPDGTALVAQQASAWNAGFDDQTKDLAATDAVFPRVQKLYRLFTAAELIVLSTGIDLLPAVSGVLHLPVMAHWAKAAGAYTLNSVARLAVRWNTTAGLKAITCETAGFMDQAAAQTDMSFPGNTGTGAAMVGLADAETVAFGKKLLMATEAGTDLSAGTATLGFTLWYRDVGLVQ